MQKTIEAVYTGGVLRPVEALEGVGEHERVLVTVSRSGSSRPLSGWRGGLDDADAAEMIQIIDREFEKVEPDEWK